ncbi:MAG TPA: elongation factor G [Spirochaetota bacterium]|nr:elongation factor G [Spirochaetota bacterium]HPP50162.1 elongation factor G [Spirochaetota bacterium]
MLKEYSTENVRTVAIVGHGSTGKSTLFDAMLFIGGQIDKIGKPDDGSLTSDYDEEEKSRKISIRSALGFVEIDDVKINIIDTPGMSDFVGEARAAIQVAEAAIVVVDAVDGVQIETEKVWRYLESKKIPRIIFINKMDKERANFNAIIDNLKSHFNAKFAAVCIPVGEADKHSGIVDLIEMKAMMPKPDGKIQVSDIPADLKKAAEDARNSLMELSAEGDDALIEKYLEGEPLTEDEMKKGLKALVARAEVFPVICGSSLKAIGIKNLLNVIKNYVPAWELNKQVEGLNPNNKEEKVVITSKPDAPFAAVVWKTYIDQYAGRFNYLKIISGTLLPETEVLNSTKNYKERVTKLYTMIGNKPVEVSKLLPGDIGVVVKLDRTATLDTLCDTKHSVLLPIIQLPNPVFSYAVQASKKGDEDKIGQIFSRITDENPTITYIFNPETKQTVLSGMGEMQLDIILKSIKEKNKIELVTSEPKIAYRETITKKAEAQYKHKKQTGGHGQYGEVFIRVAPLERGKGFEFIDSIVGGVIPRNFIPAVEKGLREGMDEGVLARFPVVDVSVELYYGSYHPVDSSEMSFKIAARQALKKGLEAAGPILLEPIMEVDVYVEKDSMGDILNDITSRRGKVLGMGSSDEEGKSPISVVKALVPLAEMLRYSIDLRAMTSGKATFEMRFSHYEPISGRIAEKVIEERKKEFAEEEANK